MAARLATSDAAFSIVPGWHTTIYPRDITITIFTIVFLVTSLLIFLIFRGTIKLLTALWTRLRS